MKARRPILVISRNKEVANWFRYMLAGRRTGLPTTLVATLEEGLRTLRISRPRVVIFVDDGAGKADGRLMLLQGLLLIEKQSQQNTLAILYDLAEGRLSMYHNAHCSRVSLEDVAQAAAETVSCPLFGYDEETAPGFPRDCRFNPLMLKAASQAARAAVTSARDGD